MNRNATRLGPAALCFVVVAHAGCGDNLTHPDPLAPYDPAAEQVLSCVPNLDGMIDAEELLPAVGVPVTFAVSPAGASRRVDQAGATDASGRLVWDWSDGAADDEGLTVSAARIEGRWYAAEFPAEAFALPFDASGNVDAIYTHDAGALRLHGLASRRETPTTLLRYDTPIEVTRFPVVAGDRYVSEGRIRDGLFRGLPYAGRDTYTVEVVDTGRLLLPDLTFSQAHLVQTEVVLAPAVGEPTTQRQSSWLFECFGEVARATSQPGETRANFTDAAEVRRMGLLPTY